jgi:protein-L-isoaspartate O-methyltransferase
MKKSLVVISVFLLCCFLNCKNKSDNNSNSDDSMQPTNGYPLLSSKEEVQEHLKGRCIDTIRFEPGETVADVGAGNGYIEAMLSIFHDSITFYIQDIDSTVCNQKAINEVITFYQNVKGKPILNKFIPVTGSDNETNLPNDTFDKILMLWTYQYFKNPKAIMTDLRLKLKKDGLLYIINPNLDYESSIQLTSEHGWNASPLEKEISDILGCGFELIQISRNNFCCENPYIFIFKKKITHDNSLIK